MAKAFSAQVHDIIRKNERVMTMVAQDSVQRLINATQVPKAKGGKMPVDTGFLRASGRMSLSGVPTGPSRPAKDVEAAYGSPDTVKVEGLKLGTAIFWGWTAIYARRQELRNGFLSSNLRNWQKFVDESVREVRNRLR